MSAEQFAQVPGPHTTRKPAPLLRFQLFSLILVFAVLRGGSALAQTSGGSVSADPQDSAFERGLIALRDGHLEAALKELSSAEEAHPSEARIRNFRGVVLASLGRNEEAASEYREAARLDPRMEDAYRNLGLLEWTERRLPAAANDLHRALTLSPDDSFAHYYLGRVLLDAKDYGNAVSELKQSSVAWPEDAHFLIELAVAYGAIGRSEDRNKTIDRLLSMQLNGVQSIAVIDLLLSVKRDAAAIKLLQSLLQHPTEDRSWARFDLARAYLVAQDYGNAAARAQEYIETSKNAPEVVRAGAWSLLGIAEANLKNADLAVNALRHAATLQPAAEEHCLNLTRELMDLSRYDEAISVLQAALTSNPKSYALHLRLGAAYFASARYPEAEKTFGELVEANDPLPISYIGLAQVLLRTGRADNASAELTAAEKKLGPSFLLAYYRGFASKQAGKPDEAVAAFKQAIQLNPSSAEAHRDLGSTLLVLGRFADAIPELKESLRLAPNDLRTRRLLSRAYARSGDVKTARQYLDAEIDPPVPTTGLQGDFILPSWQYPPQEKRN